MNKKTAKAHWEYTKGVIERSATIPITEEKLELMEYLYVEAMLHGYKHGVQSSEGKANET